MKYTLDEWQKLPREEKQKALLRFENPDHIYQPEKINVNEIDRERFK